MRWWNWGKRPVEPFSKDTVKATVADYVKDHADTLPRVRLKPSGGAVHNALKLNPADQLKDLYDPDSIGRSFVHPTEEIAAFSHVPIRESGAWIDPPSPHRIQVIKGWKNGKPVLKEYRISKGEDLAALAHSDEYKRSRLFESTGAWEAATDAKYRRYVECYSPADPEVQKALGRAAKRLREATTGAGEWGDTNANSSSVTSVTQLIDQEWIPLTGGCFTGDTKVSLLDGTERTMEELARDFHDKEFWVYSVTPRGEIVPGKAHHPRKTGTQKEIIEIELDNGELVRCTPDHGWMSRDGTYCEAKDLKSGDSLMPLYTKVSEKGMVGYRMMYQPHLNRFVYVHKSFTGRVRKGNVVHHVNFQKGDNRPDNLLVMARVDHQTLHMQSNAAWWKDPEKKASASAKISRALHINNWMTTPEGRAFVSRDYKRRKANGEVHWRAGKKGWLSERQRMSVCESELRKARVAESNHSRVWTTDQRAKTSASLREYFATHQLSEKARAALDAGRRANTIRNHKVVAVRPFGTADVYDFTVDDWHNFALSAGVFVHNSYNRQLYLYAHWEQTAKAFEAKNHNELARTAINITSDFTLGRKLGWKIKNEKVRAIWQEFWDRNGMDVRMRTLSDDLTWQGELLLHKNQFLRGFLKVQSIDPGAMREKVTNPEDPEDVYFYATEYPAPYQLAHQFNGQNLNIPWSKYVIRQYPATEIFHMKNNVSSSEKWGRSDFYASLGTLKRFRDWTNAVVTRDQLQANLVWCITVTGDDADVQAFLNDPNNAQLPAFGGTWIQNQAIKLEPMHTDVAARQGMSRGSTGQFLAELFAAGQQMPVAFFNMMGQGSARATALVQGEPFAKKIDTRQSIIGVLLDHLYETVMKVAVEAGRIDASQLKGEDADPEWVWPTIYEEDRKGKLQDLVTAKGMAAISHRRLATTTAAEFQMDSYDYEEEMDEIREEANDALLKLWPPATGGPMAVVAPPAPTAPVPAQGASPPAAPSQGQPPTNIAAQPVGDRAKINSADAKAEFKKDQAQAEAFKLSEADRAFIELSIDGGITGEVRLPSGNIAVIQEADVPEGKRWITTNSGAHVMIDDGDKPADYSSKDASVLRSEMQTAAPVAIQTKQYRGVLRDTKGDYVGDIYQTGEGQYRIRVVEYGKVRSEHPHAFGPKDFKKIGVENVGYAKENIYTLRPPTADTHRESDILDDNSGATLQKSGDG